MVVVSEAGASIYFASELAHEELPSAGRERVVSPPTSVGTTFADVTGAQGPTGDP